MKFTWVPDEIEVEKDRQEFLNVPQDLLDRFEGLQALHEVLYARASGQEAGLCPRPVEFESQL